MADRNSNYVFNLTYVNPPFTNDHGTEYPNYEITARISLHPCNIPDDNSMEIMSKELRNKNMTLSRSTSNNNIITVSGTPPKHGFDRHSILEIVRKYDTGAQLFER